MGLEGTQRKTTCIFTQALTIPNAEEYNQVRYQYRVFRIINGLAIATHRPMRYMHCAPGRICVVNQETRTVGASNPGIVCIVL